MENKVIKIGIEKTEDNASDVIVHLENVSGGEVLALFSSLSREVSKAIDIPTKDMYAMLQMGDELFGEEHSCSNCDKEDCEGREEPFEPKEDEETIEKDVDIRSLGGGLAMLGLLGLLAGKGKE